MKLFFITLLAIYMSLASCFSQGNNSNKSNESIYAELSRKALEHYQKKEYRKCAELSIQAYRMPANKGDGNHKYDGAYNAACAWTLAGEHDSAFAMLNEIVISGKYNDYKAISSDNDFASLHEDKRWQEILNAVKRNENINASAGQKYALLRIELDSLYQNDQKYRVKLMAAQQETANASGDEKKKKQEGFIFIAKAMRVQDSTNLSRVQEILDTYGWLSPDDVGFNGSQALFLVIQHADLPTQEKYLPMIRKAAHNGKTQPSNLAILEDRVALRQGKKQIYGSQVWTDPKTGKKYVDLLDDPDGVDKRRAQVGLPLMSEYLSQFFQMKWNLEEYKNIILPELLEIRNEQKPVRKIK